MVRVSLYKPFLDSILNQCSTWLSLNTPHYVQHIQMVGGSNPKAIDIILELVFDLIHPYKTDL